LSNLFKSGFVNFQEGEARVIDSNKIVAKRLGGIIGNASSGQDAPISNDGFQQAEFEEMDEETRKALFGEESGNIYREQPVYEGPSPEELLEQARQEIEEMRSSAAQEIESLKQQAFDEGQRAGYDDGFARGHSEALLEADKAEKKAQAAIQETEAVRDKLYREYEQRLQELEPMVIDELTGIYDHVFAAGLKEQSGILFHLLDTTLHRIDSGKEFIVRVSQTDYEYINAHKDELLTGMPGVRMDVVADVMMKRGEGMIETGGGIFDCSIDVELQELKRRIHMLAYCKE
jgi:flagellar assembly protein FliH